MHFYQSTGANELFVEKNLSTMAPKQGVAQVSINIDTAKTYQTMDGFGASFTDSSAYLINQVLDKDVKEDLMPKLFCHEKGIGISMIRNPMGASDYARKIYSYNTIPEGETDFQLTKFSIAHDLTDILPLTKQAIEINPNVKVAASPWSAPGWMKTVGSMKTGELRQDCYDAYAMYFVRFIQEYEKRGIPIYYITPQNEPLYMPDHYPSMFMPAHTQADFIANHLKPAFVKHGITTKILCYDHNWDRPDYPLHVLDVAGPCVDGVAWHWYGGRPVAQHQVLMAYPNKEVHFSEGSGGEWIPEFEPAFSNLMRTTIEILRNHAQSLVLWNMALDENNGPFVPGFGTSTCRGIVKVNQQTKELTYTLDYYGLAHFSKYVRPGAVRVDSNCAHAVRTVAFKNTDGSVVTVLFNDEEEARNVSLSHEGEVTDFCMPTKSALTMRIHSKNEQ